MTRSLHKGPYVDERVLKKVLNKRPEDTGVIKTWIRRSDISPEMVVLITDFLRGCADLCPTILIPGNHDFNESNKNKLDALYPVVHAMNHPNLYYSRKSEVIKIDEDTAFSHLSIYDGSDNWILAPEINDVKYKIAMYHGPVVGASTDIGFDNFINALPIETFDGFDIGLLGDIVDGCVILCVCLLCYCYCCYSCCCCVGCS